MDDDAQWPVIPERLGLILEISKQLASGHPEQTAAVQSCGVHHQGVRPDDEHRQPKTLDSAEQVLAGGRSALELGEMSRSQIVAVFDAEHPLGRPARRAAVGARTFAARIKPALWLRRCRSFQARRCDEYHQGGRDESREPLMSHSLVRRLGAARTTVLGSAKELLWIRRGSVLSDCAGQETAYSRCERMSRWLAATRRVLQAVRAIRARIHGTDYWKSTGFHDLERARRAARELENRIREGDLGWDTICPTVAEWWAQYRTAYSPKKRAPHRDPQLVAPFLARFGTARLDTFKKSDCERWVGERSKHVSARTRRVLAGDTVRREHGFLKGFFQKAVEDGLLKSNPWKACGRRGMCPKPGCSAMKRRPSCEQR